MENCKKIFSILFFLSAMVRAQFNTITYTKGKDEDKIENNASGNTEQKETAEIEDSTELLRSQTKNNSRKISWKNIFGGTSKSDLKKETGGSTKWLASQIDSLKILIKQNNTPKSTERKLNFRKIEDSLYQNIKEKIDRRTSVRSSFQKMDFMNSNTSKKLKIFMPLDRKLVVTSPYSIRVHPIYGRKRMHKGVDLKANHNYVHSVLDGIVTEAGWDANGGGNYIKIRHANRFETSYLHLTESYYKPGERVNAGFIIAKSGNTGNSTGPHLHFSVKEFGKYINPLTFLNDLIKVNNLIATYYEH